MTMSGRIAGRWRIPAYAQDMLYIVSGESRAQLQGTDGQFVLEGELSDVLRITWAWWRVGPTLVHWPLPLETDDLEWDGRVKVGGFVQRLHAREIGGMEIVIAEIVGGAFEASYGDLPSLEDMKGGIFARPADSEPLGTGQTYPFILNAESNFAALAQDALVSGLAVDAVGILADDDTGWQQVCGLPLLMESLTMLAAD